MGERPVSDARFTVLFCTSFFRAPAEFPPYEDVRWSRDRRSLSRSDVVVVHVPNWPADKRVLRRYPRQIWVAWSLESAANYPLLADDAFMRRFDLRMTYQADADVWAPYLPRAAQWQQIAAAPVAVGQERAPVVAFVSALIDRSGRSALLRDLLGFVKIDCYGKLLNNRQMDLPDTGPDAKRATAARYPFCIAFENSIGPDYVTEKIFDALAAGSIPIYLGAPNVADFVPPGSYIDAAEYGGARELGTYLNYLSQHPEAAARYHEWRRRPLPAALMARVATLEVPPFRRLIDICRDRLGDGVPRRNLGTFRRLADGMLSGLRST